MADWFSEPRRNNAVIRRTLVAAGVLFAGVSSAAAAPEFGKVTAVRFWSLGDVTRIAIEVSSDFTFRHSQLSNPERLFFDIHGARPELARSERNGAHTIVVGDGLVEQIRVAETQPDVTRIVLDLAHAASITTSQLSNPSRLMIELRSKESPSSSVRPSVSGGRNLTLVSNREEREAGGAPLPPPGIPAKAVANQVVEAPPASAAKAALVQPAESSPIAGTRVAASQAVEASQTSAARVMAIQPGESPRTAAANVVAIQSADSLQTAAARAVAIKPVESSQTSAMKLPAIQPLESKSEPRKFEPPSVQVKAKSAPVVTDVDAPLGVAALSKTARVPAIPTALPRELPPPAIAAPGIRTSPSGGSSAARQPAPAKRGDRSLTRALGLKLERVVIDAGHGGNDVGTHGQSGYYEKDLTLDVAQRLGGLIEQRMGSEVVYTRSDDSYVGLEARTRIANQQQADLFLSIHANSSPSRGAAGVETYILNFTTSKTALELAARENASSESSIHELHGLLEKIALRDKIDESREFAARLQTSLSVVSKTGTQGAKNRGVKSAPFVVLIGAEMPSVLAEIGFLTNSSEEALLRKAEHRQKIAEALYKGIAAYAETLSRVDVARK